MVIGLVVGGLFFVYLFGLLCDVIVILLVEVLVCGVCICLVECFYWVLFDYVMLVFSYVGVLEVSFKCVGVCIVEVYLLVKEVVVELLLLVRMCCEFVMLG